MRNDFHVLIKNFQLLHLLHVGLVQPSVGDVQPLQLLQPQQQFRNNVSGHLIRN